MKAVISDIHANLEALRAVLEDIEGLGIKEISCLGDVVGYGPQPVECLDIIERVSSLNIMGNHEDAVLNTIPPNFAVRARKALEWTRKVLFENNRQSEGAKQARTAFMRSFQISARIEGVTYVHGSPRDPIREYVLPRDAYDEEKMNAVFAEMEDYCFCGHSHTPGIFTKEGFTHPSDMFDLYMLGSDQKALINVGSVGQPRDGDPRACYVTFDGDTVVWRRVDYDVEATIKKMQAIPELDRFLAERLREGK